MIYTDAKDEDGHPKGYPYGNGYIADGVLIRRKMLIIWEKRNHRFPEDSVRL